jgi:hypothetical protein
MNQYLMSDQVLSFQD